LATTFSSFQKFHNQKLFGEPLAVLEQLFAVDFFYTQTGTTTANCKWKIRHKNFNSTAKNTCIGYVKLKQNKKV
jgi:hypothetical protein